MGKENIQSGKEGMLWLRGHNGLPAPRSVDIAIIHYSLQGRVT
jgi:hypothetical protein